MKTLKRISLLTVFLCLFVIGGCTQADKENINTQVNYTLNPPIEDKQEIEGDNKNFLDHNIQVYQNDNRTESKKESNICFKDISLLPGLETLREMSDEDEVAVYKLYEYKTQVDLSIVTEWILTEFDEYGATVLVSYYDNNKESELRAVVAELPSPNGNRKLSLYTPKYGDEQRIVIEETNYKQDWDKNDLEDHPLILFLPLKNGSVKEIFRGYYFHQHTCIFTAYFLTNAFYKELYNNSNSIITEENYNVGWFNSKGEEIDVYEITEGLMEELYFGVKFASGVLPQDENFKEHFLHSLALTLLTGEKSQWYDFPKDETINFLENEKVIKSYKIEDLKGIF